MAANVQPYTLKNEEGQAFWFLDTLMFVKATGEQTGGALGLIEQVLPAGSETSYHIHHAEDEYWYVLEGQVTFISGERRSMRQRERLSLCRATSLMAYGRKRLLGCWSSPHQQASSILPSK